MKSIHNVACVVFTPESPEAPGVANRPFTRPRTDPGLRTPPTRCAGRGVASDSKEDLNLYLELDLSGNRRVGRFPRHCTVSHKIARVPVRSTSRAGRHGARVGSFRPNRGTGRVTRGDRRDAPPPVFDSDEDAPPRPARGTGTSGAGALAADRSPATQA